MLAGALKSVFSHLRYLALALAISFIVFTFSVWLPNFKVIGSVWSSEVATFIDKISFLGTLYGSIATNFTAVSATYTVLIAILFGMNISMLIYYIKVRKVSIKKAGGTSSIGGLVSGIFGIGCAACGTFLLTSFLGLVGAAGLISFLPFGGEEFGVLGVVLLGWSVYATAKKIQDPLLCEIDIKSTNHEK